MITKLTTEQNAAMPRYVEKWLKIGLSTEPADFERAKVHVAEAYAVAGLKPPKNFILCTSPWDAVEKTRKLLPNADSNEIANAMAFGAHDASWLAFYDFVWNELGVTQAAQLAPLMKLAECCGWWGAYDTVAILQDRPCATTLDSDNKLHGETGAAVLYRDGHGVYAWHGMRVSKDTHHAITLCMGASIPVRVADTLVFTSPVSGKEHSLTPEAAQAVLEFGAESGLARAVVAGVV